MSDQGFGTTITFQSGLFGELTNLQFSGLERVPLETTHMLSPNGWQEFIPSDLSNAGECAVAIRWHPHTKLAAVKAAIKAPVELITITFPIPLGGSVAGYFACRGFLTKHENDTPHDNIMSGTGTIKFTGEPTMVAGS